MPQKDDKMGFKYFINNLFPLFRRFVSLSLYTSGIWSSFSILSIIMLLFSTTQAQITLSGRVTDWNGNGIPYAKVKLASAKLQTETDLSGYFTFGNSPVIHGKTGSTQLSRVSLRGSQLQFSVLEKNALVKVDFFLSNGKKVATIHNRYYQSGTYIFNIQPWMSSSSLMLLRIQIGSESYSLPLISLSKTISGISHNSFIAQSARLSASHQSGNNPVAKYSSLDLLSVEHFGYIIRSIPIENYNTTLDTLKLEYEFRQTGDPAGMVRIPGGVFQMGSTNGQSNEEPVHTVFVSPFYIDTTEVTQKEYELITGKKPWLKNINAIKFGVGPTYPAWFISWYDAAYYCNLKSKKEGKDTVYTYSGIDGEPGNGGILLNIATDFSKVGYRLPTEAEWEYACRAGTRTDYYWGTKYDSATVCQYEWNEYNTTNVANIVAQLKPNQLHLYDMAGNEFEWCNDYFGRYTSDFVSDPIGMKTGTLRSCRGRVHSSYTKDLRSTFHGGDRPGITEDPDAVDGFRIALPCGPRKVK